MDGLSVATAILTLIGAVTQAIEIVKVVYGGPAELHALFNEVSDMAAILKNINAILGQRKFDSDQVESVDHLVLSLQKAKQILELLNRFIHQILIKNKDEGVDLAVSDHR